MLIVPGNHAPQSFLEHFNARATNATNNLAEKFAAISKTRPRQLETLNVAPLFEHDMMHEMLPPVQTAA